MEVFLCSELVSLTPGRFFICFFKARGGGGEGSGLYSVFNLASPGSVTACQHQSNYSGIWNKMILGGLMGGR